MLRVAVLGTGMMGPGIGVTLALAGHPVRLYGRTPESVARGLSRVDAALALFRREELIGDAEQAAARGRIEGAGTLPLAVMEADLVFESVAEDLALKQALFLELEGLVSPTTILASNTSGLPITDIAARVERPERVLTTHFWNPPHLVPLVELVRGARTSSATIDTVRGVLEHAGKKPVLVNKDVPGQIGNRLQYALMREALHIIQEGIASVEDVDTTIKYGPGARWPVYGPLEHMDLVGLDMVAAIGSYLVPALSAEQTNPRLLQERVEAGDLGARTGRGMYDWSRKSAAETIQARDDFLIQRLKAQQR